VDDLSPWALKSQERPVLVSSPPPTGTNPDTRQWTVECRVIYWNGRYVPDGRRHHRRLLREAAARAKPGRLAPRHLHEGAGRVRSRGRILQVDAISGPYYRLGHAVGAEDGRRSRRRLGAAGLRDRGLVVQAPDHTSRGGAVGAAGLRDRGLVVQAPDHTSRGGAVGAAGLQHIKRR
jgi:hypothetical protein